jgi:hypothetical protein
MSSPFVGDSLLVRLIPGGFALANGFGVLLGIFEIRCSFPLWIRIRHPQTMPLRENVVKTQGDIEAIRFMKGIPPDVLWGKLWVRIAQSFIL